MFPNSILNPDPAVDLNPNAKSDNIIIPDSNHSVNNGIPNIIHTFAYRLLLMLRSVTCAGLAC